VFILFELQSVLLRVLHRGMNKSQSLWGLTYSLIPWENGIRRCGMAKSVRWNAGHNYTDSLSDMNYK